MRKINDMLFKLWLAELSPEVMPNCARGRVAAPGARARGGPVAASGVGPGVAAVAQCW